MRQVKYDYQAQLKLQGARRRERWRRRIAKFVSEYEATNGGKLPSRAQIAAHFNRSVAWLERLNQLAAEDQRLLAGDEDV